MNQQLKTAVKLATIVVASAISRENLVAHLEELTSETNADLMHHSLTKIPTLTNWLSEKEVRKLGFASCLIGRFENKSRLQQSWQMKPCSKG